MKNFFDKNPVVVILGVITVVEIIFTSGMQGSFFLWLAYGFYKIIQQL